MSGKSSAQASRPVEAELRAEIAALKRKVFVAERMRFEKIRGDEERVDSKLLAAGVAHEFNNILGAADGHADWALSSNNTDDMREALKIVQLACKRSSQVTRALQGLAQPREEQKDLFDFRTLCLEVESFFAATLKKHSVSFLLRVPEVKIYGTQSSLLEVLVNLVRNSLDAFATHDPRDKKISEKKILLEAFLERDHLKVRVADSGPGLPAPFRDQIFRPFFTTKGVLKNLAPEAKPEGVQGGSGLGLFWSRSIVSEHGGSLRLGASRDLPGACFEMILPLAKSLHRVKRLKRTAKKSAKKRIQKRSKK